MNSMILTGVFEDEAIVPLWFLVVTLQKKGEQFAISTADHAGGVNLPPGEA